MFRSNPIAFLAGSLWRYSAGTQRRVVLYGVLSALSMVVWTLQPAVIGALLNSIQTHGGVSAENMSWVLALVSGLFAVDVIAWCMHGPARIIEQENAHHALQVYRKHLMSGVFNLPIQWHSERDSGKVLDQINKACDGLFSFGKNSFQVIHFFVRMVVTFMVLCYYSPTIAFVTLGLIFASFVTTYQFDIKIVDLLGVMQRKENSLTAKITDSLTNIFTVKILHIERPLLAGVMHASIADRATFHSHIRIQEWKWFTGAMIFGVIGLVPMFVYIYITHGSGGAFELGTFTSLYLYSSNLIYVYYTFNGNFEELLRWKSRMMNVADIEEAIAANERHPRNVVGEWDVLHVKSLYFGYETDGVQSKQLDNVSLTIYKGQRIALIGQSGSGKTTFLKVLHGMYSSAQGMYAVTRQQTSDRLSPYRQQTAAQNITWTHTTFADIDLESTLVPQEPEVFSSTIRENITLAQDFSDEDIAHALDVARFTDVVPSLPNGLESVVNEKGVNLSGGQKQRLALARALLFSQNKSLLLLDESTSSVDPDNEAKIYEKIFDWWAGYTVIATIHKLNLLKYFDRIIIFERGRIVDDGTFDELLARNAAFRIQWAEYVKSHQGE